MTEQTAGELGLLAGYFGAVLRDLRRKARLSQKALGERLGCSGEKISKIENHRVDVSLADAYRLADELGVDHSTLVRLLRLRREADHIQPG